MLGVVENPLRTPSDDVMEKVADDMGVGDTFHPTPVGVFFGGPQEPGGDAGRRPVLRRRRARPQHLHRVRRLHDRLQVQRQEHPGEELPLPRRAEGREGAAADHGHPGPRRRDDGGLRGDDQVHQGEARHRARSTRTLTAEQVVFAAAAHRHPEAAAPDEGRGPPAQALATGSATCPGPTPSRSSARSRPDTKIDYSQGDRDHLVASTPTRTPTSSRCATARAATSWR